MCRFGPFAVHVFEGRRFTGSWFSWVAVLVLGRGLNGGVGRKFFMVYCVLGGR